MRSTYWQRTSKLLFILFQCFLHMHTFPLARHPSHISDGKEKPESFFSIHHKKLQTKWFQIIYQDITTTSMHFVVHYTSLDTSVFINNMTCTVDTWRGGYYALSIGGFFVVLLGQSLFNQVFCSPIQWTGKKKSVNCTCQTFYSSTSVHAHSSRWSTTLQGACWSLWRAQEAQVPHQQWEDAGYWMAQQRKSPMFTWHANHIWSHSYADKAQRNWTNVEGKK